MKTAIVNSKDLGTNCWSTHRFLGGRCDRVMTCNYPEKRTCKAVESQGGNRIMADTKEHPFFWLAVAMALDGKKCAICGHEYNSRESIISHAPKKGYNDDVVGAECWDAYESKLSDSD